MGTAIVAVEAEVAVAIVVQARPVVMIVASVAVVDNSSEVVGSWAAAETADIAGID